MKIKLHWQVLIALGLAVVAGALSMKGLFFEAETTDFAHYIQRWLEGATGLGVDQKLLGFSMVPVYQFVGELFLNALKMVVVPLIAASVITSIAGMGTTTGLGRLGLKTIAFYFISSFFAILVGLAAVNLLQPGYIDGQPANKVLKIQAEMSPELKGKITNRKPGEIRDTLVNIVPQNVIATASDNRKMLSLIVFSILFAVFMTRISDRYRQAQLDFWQGLFEIMMQITHFIMKFAPLGVFGLVAGVVAGLEAEKFADMFSIIWAFFLTALAALAFHAFVTIPLILKFVARVSPLRHFVAMRNALLTAFSTSSSSATLPVTIECIEENAGVSKRTASFVLPLGATVNMDGTALYECVAVMFIAQVFGIPMTFGDQFIIVAFALMTSIGVAGVPSASLFAIMIIAQYIDPTGTLFAGIAIIYFVDRPLDMLRTSVNVLSDSTAAVTIAKLEGENQVLQTVPEQR